MSTSSTTSTPAELAGRTFRMFRETHGLSLRQVAAMVPISAGHLCHIEKGRRRPSREMESRLITVYATTTARPTE